jgi:hypothetical protein
MTQKIGENRIKDSAITTAKIAAGAVITVDIADANVTDAKIVSVANTKITGNIISSQITSVANTQITGLVTTAQLAGSITSDKITSLANTKITGNIISSQITSVANTQITGLVTSAQIATVANTQITGTTGTGFVTLNTSPVLTSPTLTTATTSGKFTFAGAIDETVYAVVDAAGVALSPTNGTIQTWTLGASRTPTAGTWDAGESMTLMINDGTAYTVTWTTLAVTWVGGTAPTLATTGFTVIELWKVGSTIYGALVGNVA